jgi:hypothetical protein
MDDEAILACLRAEFGSQEITARYVRTGPRLSVYNKLAARLGLRDVQLLALWFGAEDIRMPSRVSIKYLGDHAEARQPCWDDAYTRMIAHWARRVGLDVDEPRGRTRCVFARRPFNDLPNKPKSRLSVKDFKLGQDGVEVEEADEDEDEDGLGYAHSDMSVGKEFDSSDPRDELDMTDQRDVLGTEGVTGDDTSIVCASAGLASTETVANLPVVRGRPLTRNTDVLGTQCGEMVEQGSPILGSFRQVSPVLDNATHLSLVGHRSNQHGSSVPAADIDSQQSSLATQDPVAASSAKDDSPLFSPTQSAADITTETPGSSVMGSSMAQSTPCSIDPPHLDLTPPTRVEDTTTMIDATCLKRRSADQELETPCQKRAKVGHQKADALQTIPPGTPSTPTPPLGLIVIDDEEAEHQDGDAYRDAMVQILDAPSEWLTGHIMHHFMSLITSSCPGFTTVTFASGSGTSLTSSTRLTRILETAKSEGFNKILFPVNSCNTHWRTVAVSLQHPSVRVFDSASGSAVKGLAGQLGPFLGPFLSPGDAERIPVDRVACPTQTDTDNCGVYALVFAFFVAAGANIPETLDVARWRRLLSAMAVDSTLQSGLSLPDTILEAQDYTQHHDDLPTQVKEQPVLSSPGDTTAISQLQHRVAELQRLMDDTRDAARRCLEWSSSRWDEVTTIREWVEYEVTPVISALAASAAEEAKRLDQLVPDIRSDIALYRKTISDLGTAKVVPAGAALLQDLGQKLERLEHLHRFYNGRLGKAKMAETAFGCLAVHDLLDRLRNVESGYEEQVFAARELAGDA